MQHTACHPETFMASDSMGKALTYQFKAIWPKEKVLFERWNLDHGRCVADLGCGTGIFTANLARSYQYERITGLDLLNQRMEIATQKYRHLKNLNFIAGNAFLTPFNDNTFDLTISRHVIQAVSSPILMIDEMRRITKDGGTLYFLAEDYGMIHCSDSEVEPFWRLASHKTMNLDSDFLIGHKLPALLKRRGFQDITCEFLSIDSESTDRAILAAIFEEWRNILGTLFFEQGLFSQEEIRDHFNRHIDCILNPNAFFVWKVPIITARCIK